MSEDSLHIIDRLGQEFLVRRKHGENLTVEEFVSEHPEHEGLREFLEACLVMNDLNSPEYDTSAPRSQSGFPKIEDFRIVREIGRGGMGIVFEAEQLSLNRRVAIKTISAHAKQSDIHWERFQLEARTAASLDHPNIVPVFEVGNQNDSHYLVMRLIDGCGLDQVVRTLVRLSETHREEQTRNDENEFNSSLAHLILSGLENERDSADKNDTPSPASRSHFNLAKQPRNQNSSGQFTSLTSASHKNFCRAVASIGRRVANALVCAHRAGVIHRDIKPSNLLFDSSGTVWVTDFGLVKTEDSELTQTGDFVGTLRYMSPERFSGHSDARSDVYSLGMTLYEMLAGRPAFSSPDQLSLLEQVRNTEPLRLRQVDNRIPRDLETIISKAIEKELARRYQSAQEMEADLQRFLDGRPILAREVSNAERILIWAKRNPMLSLMLALMLMGVLLTTAGSIYAAFRFRDIAEQAQAASYENQQNLYFAEGELASQVCNSSAGIEHVVRKFVRDWGPDSGRHDFRNWEWLWLQRLTQPQDVEFDLKQLHAGPAITGADFTPDGKTVAVTLGWKILIFSSDDTSDRHQIAGHTRAVRKIRFSPDGNLLASGSLDKTVRIWDWKNGKCLHSFKHVLDVCSLCWSPDGQFVVSSTFGSLEIPSEIRVFDVVGGKQIHHFPAAGPSDCENIAFSPDGRWLAIPNAQTGQVQLWNPETWTVERHKTFHHRLFHSLDWHPSSRYLVTSSWQPNCEIWDLEKDSVSNFNCHELVWLTRFRPDGKQLVTAHKQGAIRFWNFETGELQKEVFGKSVPAQCLTWNRQGTAVLHGGGENVVHIVRDGQSPLRRALSQKIPTDYANPKNLFAWTSQPDTLFTTQQRVNLRDNSTEPLAAIERTANSIVADEEGNRIAIMDRTGRLDVKNVATGELLATHQFSPDCFVSDLNGNLACIRKDPQDSRNNSPPNSRLIVWDIHGTIGPREIHRPHTDIVSARLSPDGRQAAYSTHGALILVDVATGERILKHLTGCSVWDCKWSHNGDRIAFVDANSSVIRILDTHTHEIIQTCRGHRDVIKSLSWSPDSSRIASCSQDKTVRLWDPHSGRASFVFNAERPHIVIDWDLTGQRLAAVGDNGMVTIWDAGQSDQ